MPDLTRTMIKDLFNKTLKGVHGVGGIGYGVGAIREAAILSKQYHVTKGATPITVNVGTAPNNYVDVDNASYNTANGFCLAFEDEWTTVATLTRNNRILVSGGYSGCMYSVWHRNGNYLCAHTARPAVNGKGSDKYVGYLRAYCLDTGWTLVHEIPTAIDTINGVKSGAGVGNCMTTFLATRISYTINPRPMVRTVRLRQDVKGDTIVAHRWETQTPK